MLNLKTIYLYSNCTCTILLLEGLVDISEQNVTRIWRRVTCTAAAAKKYECENLSVTEAEDMDAWMNLMASSRGSINRPSIGLRVSEQKHTGNGPTGLGVGSWKAARGSAFDSSCIQHNSQLMWLLNLTSDQLVLSHRPTAKIRPAAACTKTTETLNLGMCNGWKWLLSV